MLEEPKLGSVSESLISDRPAGYTWLVVGLLFPVALLNYLDRMMLATMRASIRADIPTIANDRDFALLMALFMWTYAIVSPMGGFLGDRCNRRYVIIGSLFIWSAMTFLTGWAETFRQMAWTRAVMGISEAFYMPTALALIAEYHPGRTRSRATAVHVSGVYAGQMLGGLGGYIADTSSWRNAFYWFGAAGLIYAVVLLLFLKDNRGQSVGTPGEPDRQTSRAFPALLGSSGFLLLVLYFTLPAVSGWAVKNWLPTFLATAFNLKQGPAGMSATGYVTMACVIGALLGGAFADRAMLSTRRGRIYVSAAGTFLCVPALLILGNAGSMAIAIAGMILFGVGFGAFDANNMPILCQLARPEHRGTGYGIMNMVSIGTGALFTVIAGAMRDRNISLGIAFSASALVALVGAVLVLFVKPSAEVNNKGCTRIA